MELILLADFVRRIPTANEINTVKLNDTPEPRDSKLANLEAVAAGQAANQNLNASRSGGPVHFGREASPYSVPDVVDLFPNRVADIFSARRGKQHPSTDPNSHPSGKGQDVAQRVILMAVKIP